MQFLPESFAKNNILKNTVVPSIDFGNENEISCMLTAYFIKKSR